MPSFVPTNYQHFVETQRYVEARRQDERSPRYEKLLADLDASIGEWQSWRRDHPGVGTITWLRASAQWLNPIVVSVGAVPLLSGHFSAYAVTGLVVAMTPMIQRLRLEWTVRTVQRERMLR